MLQSSRLRLTISPKLLTELESMPPTGVTQHLKPEGTVKGDDIDVTEEVRYPQ